MKPKRLHSLLLLVPIACVWLAAAAAHAQPASEDTLSAGLSVRLDNGQLLQRVMNERAWASRFEIRGGANPDPLAPEPERDFRLVPGLEQRQGLWTRGTVRFGNLDGGGEANDIDSRSFGAMLGWDIRLGDEFRVGLAGTYFHSTWEGQQTGGNGSGNGYGGGIYASYALPRFYTSIAIDYIWDDLEHEYSAAGFPTSADSTGQQYGLSVEVGGLLGDPTGLAFAPIGGFAINQIDQADFVAASVTSLESRLGFRLSTLIPIDPTLFGTGTKGELGIEPELHAFWHQEWGDTERPVSEGAGFLGAEAAAASFRVGVGYTMRLHDVFLLQGGYDARIASDRLDHLGQVALLFVF